jgi:hypothetical protein
VATTVRVDEHVAARLRTIAAEEHRSIGQIVADAVSQYQKEKFWAEVYESYARLRDDPEAWQMFQNEIAVFEGGSMDGLEDEPPYYSAEEEAEIRAQHAGA